MQNAGCVAKTIIIIIIIIMVSLYSRSCGAMSPNKRYTYLLYSSVENAKKNIKDKWKANKQTDRKWRNFVL